MDIEKLNYCAPPNSREKFEKDINTDDIRCIKIDQCGDANPYQVGFYTQITPQEKFKPIGREYNQISDRDDIYEGLRWNDSRFGPGLLNHGNGFHDVGWWHGNQIIRLCQVLLPEWIPRLCNRINSNLLPRAREFERDFEFSNSKNWLSVFKALQSFCVDDAVMKSFNHLYKEKVIQNYCQQNQKNETWILEHLYEFMKLNYNYVSEEVAELLAKFDLLQKPRLSNNGAFDGIQVYKTLGNSEVMRELLDYTFMCGFLKQDEIVSNILCRNRMNFDHPGIYEAACISFLASCSEGKISDAYHLITSFNINPDVCDGNGNSGIMFAIARDRLGLIQILKSFGANFDMINDDGMTPLTLALLRYVATMNDAENWSLAFNGTLGEIEEPDCVLTLDVIESYNTLFFNDHELKSTNYKLIKNDLKQLTWLYKQLNLKLPERQIPQLPYNECKKEYCDEYLLDVKSPKSERPNLNFISSKSYNGKRNDYKTVNKLGIVFNTIQILLYHGADPNVGALPMPSLHLSLFTERPELLQALLKCGADPNKAISAESVTSLHVVVSLHPHNALVEFCRLLLHAGANANARTNQLHWLEEKAGIVGNYTEEIVDEGKAPLHMIALRKDFGFDSTGCFRKVAKLIIGKGGCLGDYYLGHTPLSLAVLRGNEKLVKVFLEAGADPNQPLGEYMGTALMIYNLKRYRCYLPDVEVCQRILDLLIDYYGNPLLPFSGFENAMEFLTVDEPSADGSKYRDVIYKVTSESCTQDKLKRYILLLSRKVALKHYQSLAVMMIMLYILRNCIIESNPLINNLVKFLTIDDTIRILQIFIHQRFICFEFEEHYALTKAVLNFVIKHGQKRVSAKKCKNRLPRADRILKSLSNYHQKGTNKSEPELDKNFEHYKFCFHCGLKDEKILLPCPGCGLVYYCSENCNRQGIKKSTAHKCNLIFYKQELSIYQDAVLNKGLYMGASACKIVEGMRMLKYARKGFTLRMTPSRK